MLLTTDRRLIRIPIKTICYRGWSATINGDVIKLDHLADGIALTTDGFRHPIRFRVYEQTIKCLELNNGGYCPADRSTIFYVFGRDGRRYKDLYIFNGTNFEIGTRGDSRFVTHAKRDPNGTGASGRLAIASGSSRIGSSNGLRSMPPNRTGDDGNGMLGARALMIPRAHDIIPKPLK